MPDDFRRKCDQCPYHDGIELRIAEVRDSLREDIRNVKQDTERIREVQGQRNTLCAERGTELKNLKDNICLQRDEDNKIWDVVSRIEKKINLGIGGLLVGSFILQLIFQMWNKHQCLPK